MSNMDRYADFIAKQNGSGLFGVKSTADKIDEAKQTETQHIEITSHTGHRKIVPVHPLNARKALERYRGLTTTKSARIVSEETIEEEDIDLEESKILDAHFEKQTPEVQNRLNTLLRRGHTYPDAVKKAGATPLGEEAEQIDEISDAAKHKYLNAADKFIMSDKPLPKIDQRSRIANKVERDLLSKGQKSTSPLSGYVEEVEQIDELSRKTVASAGSKALRRALYGDEKHFKYANLASAKLYPDQYMNSPLKAKVVAKEEIDDGLEAELKAQRQTKDSLEKAREQRKAFAKEEVEEIDEGIATYDKKGKLVGNYKDLETAKKLKPGHHYAPKGTRLVALDRVGKPVWAPTFKEEVEQLDEIGDTPAGKRALGRYIKDRRGTILGAGMRMQQQNTDHSTTDKQRKDLGRKASNAFTGVARAVDRLTKEDNKFLAGALKKLEEGRGRPPKEGSPAWHRRQAELSKGKDKEEPKALEVQLRKTISINSPVTFNDGKSHDVHPNHAQKFMDHMAARRTSQEKHDFQKKASASHDAFKKAISEPVPGHKKDTGEIVKYR